jgi:signal transduction histidine kinase
VRGLRYDAASELTGRPLLDFVHPDDHALVVSRAAQTAREGTAPSAESRMLRRDGTIAYIEAEAVRLEFDGEPSNVVIAHEVGERRELFARVAAADRLLSMGTLAAGVAHEINNPLAYLVSNLELLARDAGPAHAPLVADAREAAERVSAIVRDLRELTRPADDVLGPVDVADILASSIKMANNELRHRARLVTSYAPDLPRVFASPSRLGQVFLNLLVNAAHAIVEGRADHEEVRVRATTDGAHVVVEIEDTGVGIPPDILGRVFDPFFTTKPHGVGIGLGLAIAHQIVTSVGGELAVTSAVGVGTTFRVRLCAASTAPVRPTPAPEPAPPGARRVLIIDDELAVGRAVSLLLSPEHEVTAVPRAADALVRLTAGEPFDVILCDLMMPEMNGIELYEQLPSAVRERFVFVTGGAFTPQARAFLADRAYVDKPFTEEQLRRAIDRVAR